MSHRELVPVLHFQDLQLQNISVTEQEMLREKTYFSSLTTSSVLLRQVLRYRLFWVVCLLLWVTSLRWLQRWEQCRSVLPQLKKDQLHRYRRFTYRLMT